VCPAWLSSPERAYQRHQERAFLRRSARCELLPSAERQSPGAGHGGSSIRTTAGVESTIHTGGVLRWRVQSNTGGMPWRVHQAVGACAGRSVTGKTRFRRCMPHNCMGELGACQGQVAIHFTDCGLIPGSAHLAVVNTGSSPRTPEVYSPRLRPNST